MSKTDDNDKLDEQGALKRPFSTSGKNKNAISKEARTKFDELYERARRKNFEYKIDESDEMMPF